MGEWENDDDDVRVSEAVGERAASEEDSWRMDDYGQRARGASGRSDYHCERVDRLKASGWRRVWERQSE